MKKNIEFEIISRINGNQSAVWCKLMESPRFIINKNNIQIDVLVDINNEPCCYSYVIDVDRDKSYDLRNDYDVINMIRGRKCYLCGYAGHIYTEDE